MSKKTTRLGCNIKNILFDKPERGKKLIGIKMNLIKNYS